jgi:acyl carrier protein
MIERAGLVRQRHAVTRAQQGDMVERPGYGIGWRHRFASNGQKAPHASELAKVGLTAPPLWQRPPFFIGGGRVSAGGRGLLPEGSQQVENAVRGVLRDVLGISPDRAAAFEAETPLFGALPELDSMAVAGVLTELEDRLGIIIEDDEVDGEMLETFGALARFAMAKALG